MTAPLLSIIIPAYNEERRLPATLETIQGFLAGQSYEAEVLVVENGSSDRTLEIAQEFASRHPAVKAMHIAERGKGRAVRAGMLAATGQYRFFGDADLSMPISEVNRFLPPAIPDPVVVIGSREAPGAVRYNEPEMRHISGRVFNTLVRWIALPGLQDTQCGFKLFRADAAEDVFRRQTIFGWTFDVEVLFIARLHGYPIIELGVPWYYNPDTKVRMASDAWKMARDLISIRLNARRGYTMGRLTAADIPKNPDLRFEIPLWARGITTVAGMDEAGRGAWAGPVFAAAVILPPDERLLEHLPGVRDSKLMTARQRSKWAGVIRSMAAAWGVGYAEADEVDALGIVPATRLAMTRALAACGRDAQHLLVDALRLPKVAIPQEALIKGDRRSLSIAAASVLAKTARDQVMLEWDAAFPGYGFAHNKGYGTSMHRAALEELGPCVLHRQSFAPIRARLVG